MPGADPSWLNPGDNAWQLTSATLVGIMSIPGLAILYSGLMKRKWAVNSSLMVLYAFAMTLVVWTLFAYNMSFGSAAHLGPGLLGSAVGIPKPSLSSGSLEGQASIPLLTGLIPALRFPMSSLVWTAPPRRRRIASRWTSIGSLLRLTAICAGKVPRIVPSRRRPT